MSGCSMSLLTAAAFWVLVPAAAQAQDEAAELPDGEGKQLVEGVCTACHQTNQITRSSGYTREDWEELTATMIDLSGDPETRAAIVDYLATHFPPNTERAPKLMPGDAEVAFKEWVVPTPGQRSRDPVEAADGSIWWAGQWGNLVGRIDPATGEMTEYPLPDNAMPHTVVLDAAGDVWYTGNKNGTVGKLDPDSGQITEFKMPDPAAKDPHTAVFDADGIMWFTLQQSNMLGRLDPVSGEVELVTMPVPDARPYGIKIDADGTPWFACNGSNCLVEVDPETMALNVVELPIPETTVRRLDIAGRRHDLVRQLLAGPDRPPRPADRRHQGVAVAERAEVAPLRARGRRRHRLVQRIRHAAGCAGALRSEGRDVPELADPVGRLLCRHHPAHAADRGRQAPDPPEQHQPHHRGDPAARRPDAVAPGRDSWPGGEGHP